MIRKISLAFVTFTFVFVQNALSQACAPATGAGLCPGNPPNRIDLASLCSDNFATANVIEFSWTYADSNPDGTSCGFLDSDNDGKANYAACSRSDGQQETLFLCDDTNPSKCPGFQIVAAPSLACSVSTSTVSCTINAADLPAGTVLSNVCSYTSNDGVDPNGTCKDCVFQGGAIRVNKTATDHNGNIVPQGSPIMFGFNLSGTSTASSSVSGSGTTLIPLVNGTYNVAETLPQDWSFISASCVSSAGNGEGTLANSAVSGITLTSGEIVVCGFNNHENDPAAPSLFIDKTANVSTYDQVGDQIQYSYSVTNTGNVQLTNVAVWDDKACPTSAPCITCSPSTLAANATATCGPITYNVTQTNIDNGSITNTAHANGSFGQTPVQSNNDVVTVNAVQTKSFSIDKTGSFNDLDNDGFADVGETISYQVTVTNDGNTTTTISSVSDPLVTLNCTPSLPAVRAPGQSVVCTGTYVLTLADLNLGFVDNTATACELNNPTCKTDMHKINLPFNDALDIVKVGDFVDESGDGLAQPGETIFYTITVTNTGTRSLTGVTMSDPVLAVTNCTPNQPATLAPAGTMVCTGSYAVTQADIDAGSKDNTATGDSDQTPASQAPNNEPLPQNPDLTIVKTGQFNDENGDTFGNVGETITYTITATNTGNTTLTNVVVSDPSVGALTCNPVTPTNLAPSDSIICTANYVITAQDLTNGQKLNIAAASSSEVGPREDDVTIMLTVPTPTPTPTATATPTNTPTSTPTSTPTATPTNTPTNTPTSTPTNSPTATPTNTPTATPTNTPTNTPTSIPTNTPTPTPTATEPPVTCNSLNIDPLKASLDGNAHSVSKLVVNSAKALERLGKKNKKILSIVKNARIQAQALYVKAWKTDYISLPGVVVTCQTNINCVVNSLVQAKAEYLDSLQSLRSLLATVQANIKKLNKRKLPAAQTRIANTADVIVKDSITIMNSIPNSHTISCS